MKDSRPHNRPGRILPHRRPVRARSRTRARKSIAGTAVVRAVAHLVELGVGAGIPRDVLLQAAGIAPEDLNDPDARLPIGAEVGVWFTLAKQISDPEFGVRAVSSSSSLPKDFGLLGYVVQFSGTLRAALKRIERYSRVFTEAVEFRLREGRPGVVFAMSNPALGVASSIAEDYRIAVLLQTSRHITGVAIVPIEVTFTFVRPSTTEVHARFFRCPLQFGAKAAAIVFEPRDLDLPVPHADETLVGYLSKHAAQVLRTLVRGETMRHTVRAAIWSLLGNGKPAVGEVAAVLRLPRRTIQRHLAAEGTSIQREIEAIRKTMALAIIRDDSKSIDEVAFLLGYSEPSSFYRSFRRWTGTTPDQFRHVALQ
jgi:AraC-like DNA-binding protein